MNKTPGDHNSKLRQLHACLPLGGIGGVHRGGEVSMDVSADLTELGRTPVAVVCAGAKSILDIPRTLEVRGCEGSGMVRGVAG